jgi:CRISPR-associated protein Csd1
MGWMTELSTVYDLLVQKDSPGSRPLPLYHIENNAPLTIVLDGAGNFKTAKLLLKSDKKYFATCMPCTEKSMARAGDTVAPYPLCDKLEYIAGDYEKYCSGKKLKEKYKAYTAQLEQWTNSKHSNKKIKAILNYVKKGTLATDILKTKISEISDKAGLEKNISFIRWEVELSAKDMNTKTWEDPEIQDLWIGYYVITFMNKKGFCYGSGDEEVPIAELHQGKIRHSGDKAKLVSANDDTNYTYRGRFTDAGEACQIGAEISYKAHNALRWLIHTQGTYLGNGLTVVAWCSAAIMIPPLTQNSIAAMESLDNDLGDEEYNSSQVFARALRNRLRGYYGNISKKDHILVMVLNAATTGRMSILLYREFAGSDFCRRIEDWHTNLSWFYTWHKEEKLTVHTISAPSPVEIAETAYGMHLNDDTKSMAVKRILPCILDGAIIPSDIANLCFSRASSLDTIKESFERKKVLETACAVIKYNGRILQKEDYQVGLDKERKTRDYLFGRLWAVADRIESQVLWLRDEKRSTNAVRYIQRFSKYPSSTWRFLYVEKLTPYIAHLKSMGQGWFDGIIQEIMDKFDPGEYTSDKALSGEFLLGYHCQLKAFWDDHSAKKAVKDDSANNTEED